MFGRVALAFIYVHYALVDLQAEWNDIICKRNAASNASAEDHPLCFLQFDQYVTATPVDDDDTS
jgi:hypothetical protein